MPASCWRSPVISWALAPAFMNTTSSTPPWYWTVAWLIAWRMISTPPRAVSETAIVTMAATVMTILRARLPPSREVRTGLRTTLVLPGLSL